ncbi:AAA family ATPase, partial [Erysipelatoclostridium ramosum]
RLVMIEDERIYHHTQYDAQNGIASFLAGFPYRESEEEVTFDIEDIGMMEQKFHIRYEDKQKEAITAFFKEPFLILTGGPGTGKTTIVKGILDLYQRYYP